MTGRCIATRSAAVFAHPVSIAAFPLACAAWLFTGYGIELLTLLLSVLAISTTQLVLLAQDRDTRAVHAKLDAVVRGTDADDAVAGIERA